MGYKREPREEFPDLEKEFEPSLLNSTVYIMGMFLQVSTFAINYRGHPFMESLVENRPLLYSLAGAGGFVVMLALGWLPEFSNQFSIGLLRRVPRCAAAGSRDRRGGGVPAGP